MRRFALFFGLSLGVLGLARHADAASATCMGPDGSCEVSNDDDLDSFGCQCSNGGGDGGAGGMEWAGLSEAELQDVCDQVLEENCGDGPPPPAGIPCEDKTGSCVVDNMPNFVSCVCTDQGFGDGGEGGNSWDDYDEDQLYEECLAQLESFCGAVEPTGGSMDSGGDSADGADDGPAEGGDDGADGGDTGAGDGTEGGADGNADEGGAEAGQEEGGADAGQGDAAGGDTGNDTDGSGADGGGGDDGGSKGCSMGGGSTVGLLSLALLFGVARRRPRVSFQCTRDGADC